MNLPFIIFRMTPVWDGIETTAKILPAVVNNAGAQKQILINN